MAKKLSPTLKAVQQAFFEQQGMVKQVASKKDAADTVYPLRFRFTYDSNEVEHVVDGMYKYIKSQTKLGKHVQISIVDIEKWINSKNIVICPTE